MVSLKEWAVIVGVACAIGFAIYGLFGFIMYMTPFTY